METLKTMASFNELIVQLREKTGAGMMDCKKALTEGNGDFDKALEILRKKGQADAAKKSARTTKEGLIGAYVSPDGKKGAIIELNCETDFVAKTDEFQALATNLAKAVVEGKVQKLEDGASLVQPAIAKLGENMSLRRFERFELKGSGLLAQYIHTSGGKKGAFVEFGTDSDKTASNPAVQELAKKTALQIVGMSPRWVKREDVPASEIEKEKDIHATVVRQEGKPEAAIAKIVEGKLNKLFFGAFCLLEQPNMWDNKTPMKGLVDQAAKDAGGSVEVKRFVRYQLGD